MATEAVEANEAEGPGLADLAAANQSKWWNDKVKDRNDKASSQLPTASGPEVTAASSSSPLASRASNSMHQTKATDTESSIANISVPLINEQNKTRPRVQHVDIRVQEEASPSGANSTPLANSQDTQSVSHSVAPSVSRSNQALSTLLNSGSRLALLRFPSRAGP